MAYCSCRLAVQEVQSQVPGELVRQEEALPVSLEARSVNFVW